MYLNVIMTASILLSFGFPIPKKTKIGTCPFGGMADTQHSKCCAARRVGSSPTRGIAEGMTATLFVVLRLSRAVAAVING